VLEAAGVTVVHALPGVGRNLQDHVATGLHYRVSRPISLLNATGRRPLAAFLLRGRGMLTSNVAEGSAFVRSDPSLGAPDLQYVFAPALYSGGEEAEVTEHGFTLGVMLLTPRSTGTISLASNDRGGAAGHPRQLLLRRRGRGSERHQEGRPPRPPHRGARPAR